MTEWWLLLTVGFVAQLIEGALGMAYGVLANSALLVFGVPPAKASGQFTPPKSLPSAPRRLPTSVTAKSIGGW